MKKTYRLVELFSGIGSQAKALKNLGIDVSLQGTSEWDVHAIAAYDVIHNPAEIPEDILRMNKKELLAILDSYSFSNSGKTPLASDSLHTYSVPILQRLYASIQRNNNFVDVTKLSGEKIPDDVDIMTYSFPCQDLSNVGAFHGYNKGIDKDSGSRSSLLWQVGRILTEMQDAGKNLPRFLLMENVPTLLSKRHFTNFKTWINDLETLGYVSQYYQLNASSFGLPQNRPRLLMISVFVGQDARKWKMVHDYFEKKNTSDAVIEDYRQSSHFIQYSVQELLRTNYTNKKIYAEALACTPNDTVSRRKIWEDNPQIILPDQSLNTAIDAIRTITTKQDRNPNSGNLYFDSGVPGKSTFRYLTPRECLLFMGFTDEDYKNLRKNNVEFHKGDFIFSRDKIIRMAGNSIPVKLLEGIFYQIILIDQTIDEHEAVSFSDMGEQSCVRTISEMLTTHVFKSGIRSRIKEQDVCPSNALRVYPKYRTAIYIQNCMGATDSACGTNCLLCDYPYWAKRYQSEDYGEVCYREALNVGWNAIVLYPCDFEESRRGETLAWVVQCIKEGLVEDNRQKVYRRGRQ